MSGRPVTLLRRLVEQRRLTGEKTCHLPLRHAKPSPGVGEPARDGSRPPLVTLASDYVHSPMVPVVRGLIILRDDVTEVLPECRWQTAS